ncbi:hypothetical protein BI49514_02393 [Brevibacterium iodinum ATCC 49514]|uniref:PrgI family protein n=1 Tax=Brevibacterium iodinum ATCC 49514 TaxID=1255616 RepID=A0A2H1JV32_9MICO|nr:SCO6880 family protein [Brevibacterium iodinum]SMX91367.1 hypothetical protein BI49514_02393 [Brevibacterium iodinum ATCC 49514]SUW70173.1 Type IV secretory pathway, VirB4 components [Brevibacterium iodinum]
MTAQIVNDESSEWDGARFGREESTGVAFGMDMLQIVFLGVGMVIIVVCVVAGGFPGGLIAAALTAGVFGAIGIPRIFGKSLLTWVRVILSSQSRKRTGQNEYLPEESGVDVVVGDEGIELSPELEVIDPPRRSEDTGRDKKGRIKPLKPGRLLLPGEFSELLVYQMPGGAAFAYDPVAKEGIVVAQISTHKAFGLESFEDQETRLRAWAEAEATIAGIDGVLRVQMADQTTIASGSAVLDHYEQEISNAQTVVDPDTGETVEQAGEAIDPFLHQSLVDMLVAAEGRPVHGMWMAVVLSQTKLAKRIHSAGRGIRGFMETALVAMGAVESALPESGTEVVRWHSPRSLAALVRTAFDPAASVEISEREDGVDVGAAGPMWARDSLATFASEGAIHRTFKVSEFPRSQAQLGFLQNFIFSGDFRHTVSVYMKPRDIGKALKTNERSKATWTSNATLRDKLGKQTTLRHDRQLEDLSQEESELERGHAALKMTVMVTVSAFSEEEMDASVSQLKTAAARANCELRVMYGQQDSAFMAAATPLGRLNI